MIIYKYKNRKYYSSSIHCHLNLSDIHAMVENGIEFKVLDHCTKNNITTEVKHAATYHAMKSLHFSKKEDSMRLLDAALKEPKEGVRNETLSNC